jgi:hypothetical protein
VAVDRLGAASNVEPDRFHDKPEAFVMLPMQSLESVYARSSFFGYAKWRWARALPTAAVLLASTLCAPLPAAATRICAFTQSFGTGGMNAQVNAFAVFDDGTGPALYAGGDFTTAGGVAANRVAKWNGTSWSVLGAAPNGVNGTVNALAVYDDGNGAALYAGGSFTSAGGVPASFVAKWTGSGWSAVGGGTDGFVYALTVYDDGAGPALYAAGSFGSAGGVTASWIAKWDGSSWSPLGSGLSGGFTGARALAVHDDGSGPSLFVGGDFTRAGGASANRVAKWDGATWSRLDYYSFGDTVYALAVYDDGTGPKLFAGGRFTDFYGAPLIAKWDGSTWQPLNSPFTGLDGNYVRALSVYNDGQGAALYVGGSFWSAGYVWASNVARWNGASWSALGSPTNGVNSSVYALASYDSGGGPGLFLGGPFTTAGGMASNRIARWQCVENQPPEALDDTYATDEDTPIVTVPLGNDTDPELERKTVTAVTQGSLGSVQIGNDPALGYVTYTPNPNANGSDSFTYTVSDPHGASDNATVWVTIQAVNDRPATVDDVATTDEDAMMLVDVLANDSDVDGDPLVVGSVEPPAHGSAVSEGGRIRYTPQANFYGGDSFVYRATDPAGESTIGVVTVTVRALPDAPVAHSDSVVTSEDTAVTVAVVANDTDADGDPLSVTAVTQGANGSAVLEADGRITYWPVASFNGSDAFDYTISDGNGGTAAARVDVAVSAVNDVPTAVNDAASTTEDAGVSIAVLANDSDLDGDLLTISGLTQGAKGTATVDGNGSVTYVPAPDAHGTDSFTYSASDGQGGVATATVTVTIAAINDAPDAVNDAAATIEDTAVSIAVVANDTDVDGDALVLVVASEPARGAVTLSGDRLTYTPNTNVFGTDNFTYTVRDPGGLVDTATVGVSIAPVNDPPVAVDDSAVTDEGRGVTVAVLANDADVDGDALAVTAVSTPTHGTATINGDGTVTYASVSTYSGSDLFSYTISDGTATATAIVAVQVKELLSNVTVLGTHGVWLESGADVLGGDVIVNAAGSAPFLDAGVELSVGGGVTTAVGWDLEGNRVNVASGATVASDVYFNQLTQTGTVSGARYTPLALPVFPALPSFRAAVPGGTDVNVANNGSRTLAPGSYRDLIVGRRATVTFTGGVYHFRSLRVDREAKLLFGAASDVRIQQKVSTNTFTSIGPSTGSTATAASIIFYVGGSNGTGGGLAETPKAVEIGTDNVISANLFTPNGTLWLKDRSRLTGSLLGRDVRVGPEAQLSVRSAW